MHHLRKFRFFGMLLVIAGYSLQPASAGVMTGNIQLAGSLEDPAPVAIDKFDPLLGTLTEVRLSYELLGVAQFVAGDPNLAGPWVSFFDLASSVEFGPFLGGPLSGQAAAVFLDGQPAPGGIGRVGIGFGFVMGQGAVASSDPGMLTAFTSTGVGDRVLNLPISATRLQTSSLSILSSTSRLSGQLGVTYVFSEPAAQGPIPNAAVPEPASLAVFGIGAIMMVRSRRRRR